ncbi:hypothetical protein J3Q64DRAFT_1820193 [Phycomyces blakesleeanus]|uniref:Reticulon-like protein n=1 Tax=Phycomyces blakesleeanus TaxID=4837 RepID=A0ABR3B6U5_PHYBL
MAKLNLIRLQKKIFRFRLNRLDYKRTLYHEEKHMTTHNIQYRKSQPVYSHPDLTPRINLLSTKTPRSDADRRQREPPSQQEPQKRDLFKVGSRLIYWESPIHSLIVLAGLLLLVCWSPQHLILGSLCWIISLDLAIVQAARILHNIVFRLPYDTVPHPFKTLLRVSDQTSLSRPSSSTWAGMASTEMYRVILVQDKRKSLMWLAGTMSYLAISAWVSTRTLLILACIGLFSVPKVMLDLQNTS